MIGADVQHLQLRHLVQPPQVRYAVVLDIPAYDLKTWCHWLSGLDWWEDVTLSGYSDTSAYGYASAFRAVAEQGDLLPWLKAHIVRVQWMTLSNQAVGESLCRICFTSDLLIQLYNLLIGSFDKVFIDRYYLLYVRTYKQVRLQSGNPSRLHKEFPSRKSAFRAV